MSILEHALKLFNEFMGDAWSLLSEGMDSFLGGGVWQVMVRINQGLQAGGLALLVVFTLMGMIKAAGTFAELKRPEAAFKIFIRFIIAKGLITYGATFMLKVFNIVQAVLREVNRYGSGFQNATLPKAVKEALETPSWYEIVDQAIMGIVGILCWIVILIVSMTILVVVYSRFFRLYLYTAVSPIMLSTLGGEPTQSIGIGFLKSYGSVCLEGVIITAACVIYSKIARTAAVANYDLSESWGAVLTVLEYTAYFTMYALVLLFTVKGADRISREMMGNG